MDERDGRGDDAGGEELENAEGTEESRVSN